MLMHDIAALAKFRRDHGFFPDVNIEIPRPNEVAVIMQGDGNRIPFRIWLIYKERLWFLVNPFLKVVMARCFLTFMQVSINFVMIVMAVDTLMRREGMSFSTSNILHMYYVVQPKCELG